MRRGGFGGGIRGLKGRRKVAQRATVRGKELEHENFQHVEKTLAEFKSQLEDFSRRYKADIGKDPVFRAQFQKMCSQIGVDPLASGKGFWGELLGLGPFYYELGVQIVDACYSTRERNGGLIALGDLKRRLRVMRGRNAVDIGEDDVRRALDKLQVLGGGFGIVEVAGARAGRMQKMVVTVPRELSRDHTSLIAMASGQGEGKGWVSVALLQEKLAWPKERSRRALASLESEGMVWRDDTRRGGGGKRGPGAGAEDDDGILFWFPCMFETGSGQDTDGSSSEGGSSRRGK